MIDMVAIRRQAVEIVDEASRVYEDTIGRDRITAIEIIASALFRVREATQRETLDDIEDRFKNRRVVAQ